MKRNFKAFVGISIIAGSLCFLLIREQIQGNNSNSRFQLESSKYEQESYLFMTRINPSDISVEEILRRHNLIIRREMEDYKFPRAISLENFTLATNGQPLRNIIVATWRSGSSFLGDVINSVPGNFYHYEPLMHFGVTQIRGGPHSKLALEDIFHLLNCDYSDLGTYLDYGLMDKYVFAHNRRLWRQCDIYPQFCWMEIFLRELCRQFPFQSMKIVRVRLSLMEDLLKSEMENIRMILLLRDPRAVLQSRKHKYWCRGVKDCEDPFTFCSDMVSNYYTAVKFRNLYPDKFRVFRYEDIVGDLEESVKELLEFFGLNFHPAVEEFLESNLKINVFGVSDTFRNSKNAPHHWKVELKFEEVLHIQENCIEAMNLWGYIPAKDESDLHVFNPLSNFTMK